MGVEYSLLKKDKPVIYDLDKGDWFPLCGSENYCLFKVGDLWTEDSLTEFIYDQFNEFEPDDCRIIAKDIIQWAGDDVVTLVPDTDDYRCITWMRFKFRSTHHKIDRDRYSAFKETR